MKTFKPLLFLLALVSVSCVHNFSHKNGSGNVITQTRNVTGFTAIEVESGIHVDIMQGDNTSVVVEADDNVIEHISTRVVGGVLKISLDKFRFNNVDAMNVKVSLPEVTGVKASGGSSVASRGLIRSGDLQLLADSGSEMKLEIEADKMTCETSSGSSVTLSGKALAIALASSSGSDIDAAGLRANDITAKSSSGSSIDVRPTVSLDAEASSGSSIDYYGEPKTLRRKENSGGSVSNN